MRKLISHPILIVLSIACWIGSGALGSTNLLAAQWLAPAAADHITADWVKQIEADLNSKQFKDVFRGMPVNPPIPAVLHLLNSAARALADNKKDYAKLLINDVVRILNNGISKGWYSPSDIEPVQVMIRKRADAALEGKTVSSPANQRWTGYSDNKPLGLTNALGEKQQAYVFEDATNEKGTQP